MHLLLLALSMLLLGGCAYVGDPLPPALKVPSPVTDLAVRQVGAELLVSFTIPDVTMEGLALAQVGNVDLRIGPDPAAPFNPEQWSGAARAVETAIKAPGKVDTKLPAGDWANQEVIIGVRLANAKNRLSPWSNFVTLRVATPLAKPAGINAIATAEGVALDWTPANTTPGIQWKVFRLSTGDATPTEMATVSQPKFLDTGAVYDSPHIYTILALDGAAVSEISEPLTITPIDKFAPVAPQGLSALAGPAAAQLSWERNQETDLALYRIYRSNSGADFTRIAELPTAANYRDTTISAGQTYRYAVSAVDRKGNESPKSQAVEILIP
jgi:hypothetical protein